MIVAPMLNLDGNPAEPVSCRISSTARSSSLNRIKHNMCHPDGPLLLAPLGHAHLLRRTTHALRVQVGFIDDEIVVRTAPVSAPLAGTAHAWQVELLSGKIQCSVQNCSEWSEPLRRL